MADRLFLSPPHMGGHERLYVEEVFDSNYIAPLGAFVDRFEQAVRDFTGASAVTALSSGTAALHLALRLAGVGKKDRVAVGTFTFIASVSPILYQGAEPVFIDCDESWQMDVGYLEEALKKERPKAVIVPHLYGQVADIKRIASLCEQYEAVLIEDAAESLGATFHGRHSGTFGAFGVYSFNGNKIITTGGGGMLAAQEREVIARAKKLATQAREPAPWYEHEEWGYNYRLSNVLAAIGVGQMEVLSQRIEKKRQIYTWYRKYMSDVPGVCWMPEIEGSRGTRWLTTCTVEGMDPVAVMRALEKRNIETRPLWKPMHTQPLFAGSKVYGGQKSETLFANGLCLPCGTAMEEADVAGVVDYWKKALT